MRRRPIAIISLLMAAGILLLAWSQPWFVLDVDPGSGIAETLVLAGDTAAPAIIAIALAVIAVALVLALAGPRLRILLSAVIGLLGVIAVATAIGVLNDPAMVFERVVSDATGLGGTGATDAITTATVMIWPFVAIIGGVATAILGAVIAVVSRDWRSAGRRYERGTVAVEPGDSVAAWDAISGGDDPTTSDAMIAMPTGTLESKGSPDRADDEETERP